MSNTGKLGRAIFIACLMIVTAIVPMTLFSGAAVASYDTLHAPIIINGDADFAAQAFAENWDLKDEFGVPTRDGTELLPYVIGPDYRIESYGIIGITIMNTRVHFTIQSVLVFGGDPYATVDGIYLENVWNADINQCIVEWCGAGLHAYKCNYLTITGGSIATPEGWYLGGWDYFWNAGRGIWLSSVSNCVIDSVSNWYDLYGIYAANCINLAIRNSDMEYAYGTGLYAGNCAPLEITNTMSNYGAWNGFDIRACTGGVTLSSLSAIVNPMNGIYLRGNGITEITSVSCTWNSMSGIYGYQCADTSILQATCEDNGKGGVYLVSCTNSLVSESTLTFARNGWNGITLQSCTGGDIDTCTATQNANGIAIISSTAVNVYDTSSTVNNLNGIFIQSSSDIIVEDVVDYNDFSNNLKNGLNAVSSSDITLSGGVYDANLWHGIYMMNCPAGVSIEGSEASSNTFNGIHLANCPCAIVSMATASSNGYNGIYLKGSAGVLVDSSSADSNSNCGIYVASSNGVTLLGTQSLGNIKNGIYFGLCHDPTADSVTSSSNGRFGIEALGCVNVQTISCTCELNGEGPFNWPNAAPVAIFSINRIDTIAAPTNFDATASWDSDGTVVMYLWDFGDGKTLDTTSPTATHQYKQMDNYVVKLRVRDEDGRYSTQVSKPIAVQTDLCPKIIMPDRATVGELVHLDASESYSSDPARTITNYIWDFDDLSGGSGVSTDHAWTLEGSYQVKLRVQDDIGRISPNMTARIKVGSDSVVALSMNLTRYALLIGETAKLTIRAVDSAGHVVESCTDTVDVSANRSGLGWTGLPTSVALVDGKAVIVISCSNSANYNITAEVQGAPEICGSVHVTVATQTVEIRIYDFMQLTLGINFTDEVEKNYWNPLWRGKWGDQPWRYEAPAYHLYATGLDKLKSNVDTTYRINVTARDITSINMADPLLFPKMNSGIGGQMSFTWDYYYLNEPNFWWWNFNNKPPMPSKGYGYDVHWTWSPDDYNWTNCHAFYLYSQDMSAYDGWETLMNITVTMNREAAYEMIGLPLSETNIAHWWNWYDTDGTRMGANDTVRTYWESTFMRSEGGGGTIAGRLDIKSCDDGYPWEGGFWGSYYTLKENGDGTVSLHIWRIGYGEDTLIARWLYWGGISNGWNYPDFSKAAGIVPFEPYYDDVMMSGKMDDTSADINFDAGIIYGFRAQKSQDPSVSPDTAVWRWEQVMVDYAGSTGDGTWNRSEMDVWVNNALTFDIWDPAGTSYGITIAADQSPNVVYLDVGEAIIMEKSRIPVSGIMGYPLVGDSTEAGDRDKSGYNDWVGILEKWGYPSIHPLGCRPYSNGEASAVVDQGTGDCVFVGPFNPVVPCYDSPFDWLQKESAPLIEYWIE